jgi:two-component system nitrogen regulation response regulator NtrX
MLTKPSLDSGPALSLVSGWPPELLGPSPAASLAREQVVAAGRRRGGALLLGERGFDLEAIARWVHECGDGRGPFVAIDCASADPHLLESALFGDRAPRGGSPAPFRQTATSQSRFAAALGGTLYLAHLTDMPAGVQARLAHLLRDGEILIDGDRTVQLDLRIIAAALPDIQREVEEGKLREDLFRRLSGERIVVPALRARPEDVVFLTQYFADREPSTLNGPSGAFTHAALASLATLPLPGNVAELRDLVHRLCAAANGQPIRAEDVLSELRLDRGGRFVSRPGTLRDARRHFEREYIGAVLSRHGWRIAEAAATLGIERANLYRKIRQIGLSRPSTVPGDTE